MTWKTKGTKEVYKNKWMTVTEDEVETEAGEKLTYSVVHKEPFALIIPWDGSHFTLVGQYRYAIQKFSWEFPQGHFEHNSIEETAKTELHEETGLSAGNMQLIGHFYLGPGHHTQLCNVFLAQNLTQGPSNLQEGEKGIQVKKVTLLEIKEMIKTSKMEDGPSLAAFSIYSNFTQ